MPEEESETSALLDALRAAVDGSGITQRELGERVAELEQRRQPYTQAIVSGWLTGKRGIPPHRVFQVETVLELPPGSISIKGGYLPASAVPVATVAEAIDADVDLTPAQREDLRALYETQRARTRALREKRRSR